MGARSETAEEAGRGARARRPRGRTGRPTSVLIADDDGGLLDSLSLALRREGFEVFAAADGVEACERFAEHAPDLVVLDIRMPRRGGAEALAEIRRTSDVPVIFLTSLAAEEDEILGLRAGADDYVGKPFSPGLLAARLRALERRARALREGAAPGRPRAVGPLLLDPEAHACRWRGREVRLTVTEFMLLEHLARHAGRAVDRERLRRAVYDDVDAVDERAIDSHVRRLRGKMRAADPGFDGIETLYGIGYRLSADPSEGAAAPGGPVAAAPGADGAPSGPGGAGAA